MPIFIFFCIEFRSLSNVMLDDIRGGIKMKNYINENLSKVYTRLFLNYNVRYNKKLNKLDILYNTKSNIDIFLYRI